MKTLLSYAHTGQKLEDLHTLLDAPYEALQRRGVETYCTLYAQDEFDGKKMSARDIMFHAFQIIDGCDFLLVVQANDARSEGMLIEVGYCIAKDIPVVVAIRDGLSNTYLPSMAHTVIHWKDAADLARQFESFDFTTLAR